MVQTESETRASGPGRWLALAFFLLIVVVGGGAIGVFNLPGAWYAQLAKPSFNPPNWIFGPVWTTLYVFIAVAGWRTWVGNRSGLAMKLWWAQLALNWLWSPVFFSAHMIGAALAVALGMLAAIVGFIATSWKTDRLAALLFVPYAAWVSFASLLNGAILVLN